MTVEWIAFDVNTHQKPEVLELCNLTGEPIEVVFYRIYMLWSWFQMHSADGDARVTLESFATVAGGDAQFWTAVVQVGWLEQTTDGIRLPKFEERFSNSAKSKKRAAMRQQRHRDRVTVVSRERNGEALPDKIIQDKKINTSKAQSVQRSSPATDGIWWDPEKDWSGITDIQRDKWSKAYPAANIEAELAKASAWCLANPKKAKRTANGWARFLDNWLKQCQDKGGTRNAAAQAGPRTQENKRFWRDDFCRNMTDHEYKKAKQQQPPATGSAALDIARKLKVEVAG